MAQWLRALSPPPADLGLVAAPAVGCSQLSVMPVSRDLVTSLASVGTLSACKVHIYTQAHIRIHKIENIF